MKPRLRKVGRFWLCRSPDGIIGIGLTPSDAFVNWYRLRIDAGYRF